MDSWKSKSDDGEQFLRDENHQRSQRTAQDETIRKKHNRSFCRMKEKSEQDYQKLRISYFLRQMA
jgi:hypothetical protein